MKTVKIDKNKILGNIESIYNEWNYVFTWGNGLIQKSINEHKTALGASFVSSVMTVLQKGRTDKAMYYDVQSFS